MKRKLPETISEEDMLRIVNAENNPRYKLDFLLGFYQCLRVSEVINLLPQNIDKNAHIIHIKKGKGEKDRDIVIVKPLKINPASYIYGLNKLPIGVKVRALQIEFKKKSKDTLNRNLHFHTLRHSGATWLLNKKRWDIRQVQRFLGHSKLQSTEIYTHVNPRDLVELEWGEN